MAITTVAGAIEGAQPPVRLSKLVNINTNSAWNWSSHWYLGQEPPAASVGSAGMAGEALTSVTGQLPFHNPPSGNTYLMHSSVFVHGGASMNAASMMLVDRLWQNSGIDVTVTTAQTIDSVAWPARDMNASTNGAGVWVALEISTVTGAGAATPVIEYTNSAGDGSKVGTCLRYAATAAAGRICFFDLAAGDVGVRSVQTITLGTSLTSGVVHLVAFRPICKVFQRSLTTGPTHGGGAAADILLTGFQRLYDNSVLQVVGMSHNGSSTQEHGSLTFTQG
jgi:hypothetical protein